MFSLKPGSKVYNKEAHLRLNENNKQVTRNSTPYVYSVVDNFTIEGNFLNKPSFVPPGIVTTDPTAKFEGTVQIHPTAYNESHPLSTDLLNNTSLYLVGDSILNGDVDIYGNLGVGLSADISNDVTAAAYRFQNDPSMNLAVGNGIYLASPLTGTDNLCYGNYSSQYIGIGDRNVSIGNYNLNSENATMNCTVGHGIYNQSDNNYTNLPTQLAYNTILGYASSQAGSTGYNIANTAIGTFSQFHQSCKNPNGSLNTSVGYNSLNLVHGGRFNTSLGGNSFADLSGSSYNIALGYYSGQNVGSDSSNNIFIGNHNALSKKTNIEHDFKSLFKLPPKNKSPDGISYNCTVIGNDVIIPHNSKNLIVLGNKESNLLRPDNDQVMNLGSPEYKYNYYFGNITNPSLFTSQSLNDRETAPCNYLTDIIGNRQTVTIDIDIQDFTCDTNDSKPSIQQIIGKVVDGNKSNPSIFTNNKERFYVANVSIFFEKKIVLDRTVDVDVDVDVDVELVEDEDGNVQQEVIADVTTETSVESKDFDLTLAVVNPNNFSSSDISLPNIGDKFDDIKNNSKSFSELCIVDLFRDAGGYLIDNESNPAVIYSTLTSKLDTTVPTILPPGCSLYLMASNVGKNKFNPCKLSITLEGTNMSRNI